MFTLKQIKTAHGRVKTGADFPRYVQEIKRLGLKRYEYMVTDGQTIYYGEQAHKVAAPPIYGPKSIARVSSPESLKHIIAIHQQGKTDFPTFCSQAATAGVEKWVIDTELMLCTYYDLAGAEMVAEPIRHAEYV